jgi:Fur family ferric uptake transcriptional regulator
MEKDEWKQKASLKMTPQRRAILEELAKLKSHPTADEVFVLVRKKVPKVSLATVYRNLEYLAEAGMIQKLELTSKKRRYDADTESHYHFRCLECGKVFDLALEAEGALDELADQIKEFEVLEHCLEFRGRCPECTKKNESA